MPPRCAEWAMPRFRRSPGISPSARPSVEMPAIAQARCFGLTVTEALWKGRPTIGGNVGGIPLQIEDGVSGYLVSSSEEAAQRTLEIMRDPELAKRLGKAGKEHARQHFLSPRLLGDWLGIFNSLGV